MSETDGTPGADGVTAGRILREAREAYGLHVDTLAANLKVPVRKIQALEEDRYDEMPDAVFLRALASSMCRTLKIDPQPVLDRLPQTEHPRLAQDADGINKPFRAPGVGPKQAALQQVSRPVVLIVVALLLATAAVVFLPTSTRDAPAPKTATAVEPAMPGTVTSAPAEPAAGGAVPVQPLTASPSAAAPAPASGPAAGASAPLSAAAPAASAASAPMPASGVVTFRTRGSSWIQVTDANGTAVLRKLMEAGETAGASGALPLSITIGSVEQTEVQVRGKPFNLGPVSRDNVARFEVK